MTADEAAAIVGETVEETTDTALEAGLP